MVKDRFKTSRYEIARGLLMKPTEDGVRKITIVAPASMGKTTFLKQVKDYYHG